MKDMKYWATMAMNVQDACNLSGIVHSFSEFMTFLRQENPDKGTDWLNSHPVAVLFADKIKSLTTAKSFSNAYAWCSGVAEGRLILLSKEGDDGKDI